MKNCHRLVASLAGALVVAVCSPALAQVLYTQDFQADDTANWTVNVGPTDEHADFFYDYGTAAGIPLAPNSAPSSPTRGMKLQANLTDGVFGGFSVSPTGQSFTGDYALKFDLWSNYIGADPGGIVAGATGSTQLSLYGIMTSGTVSNWPGNADSVYFANVGDISSTAFRTYSNERVVSYKGTNDLALTPPDPGYNPAIDPHNTYFALDPNGNTTRSNNAASATLPAGQLYLDTFPSVTVPAAQTALFPETQHGSTTAGAFGFAWHEVEIRNVDGVVTCIFDGVPLAEVDTKLFALPPVGENILFGHSDVNATFSQDPYYPLVQFTLVDNITVETITATPTEDADFDGDGDVDGADFLTWQRGVGTAGDQPDGDANDDNAIDGADLDIWEDQFGPAPPVAAIPEPQTWVLASLAAIAAFLAALPRRRAAPVVVRGNQH